MGFLFIYQYITRHIIRNIPAIFLHYNKCVNNWMLPESSRHDGYGPARRAFLVGYDRRVPRPRQAAHCIGCGRCASKCPQGIDIPSQMQSVDRFVERLRRDEP